MTGILIGIIAGTYINNPGFRKTVDNVAKELLGKGIDMLNTSAPVTSADNEPEGE